MGNTSFFKALGLMSGTSMDGVDVALLKSDGAFKILQEGGAFYPYDPSFQKLLKEAEKTVKKAEGKWEVAEKEFKRFSSYSLEEVIQQSTEHHVKAALRYCEEQGVSLGDIQVVGYHGQTVYHAPQKGVTLQWGHPKKMAQTLKVPVVFNIRQEDVKAQGQGAPFAPLYHHALLVRDERAFPQVVVNCGGISNITWVPGEDPQGIMGIDTGPGNVFLDRFVFEKTKGQESMDPNGSYGMKGQIHGEVLSLLQEHSCWVGGHNYYLKPAPKSLDIRDFTWPMEFLSSLSLEDGCATLAVFTAKTIVEGLEKITKSPVAGWILAGGGWHNQALVKAFHHYAKARDPHSDVHLAKEIGWDGDVLEAELMAYLAIRHLKGFPTSLPQVTGATHATVGGELFLP